MSNKDNKNNPELLGNILKNVTKQSIQDNAEKEKQKAYDISRIFQQMELDLISSMKRAFYFHQVEQAKEGFVWEQWQLSKLRAMEEFRKRNKAIVDSYSEPIQQTIDRELNNNFEAGEKRVEKVQEARALLPSGENPKEIKDIFNPSETPPPEQNFFGLNKKKLEALQSTVKHDIKEAQFSVLRKMDDVYRQTLFKTHVYLQNGTKTLDQAIDMATKDFLEKGIDSVVYKNGARVNIASYAEMALRTASQRATFLGEGTKRDEWGLHLVVVSAHGNTCEMCEPWQGKILIDEVFSHPSKEYLEENSKYPPLSEAIKAGLLHPNCRHSLITYFPGITRLPKVPNGKEAIRVYNAEQQQRAYERQIRKWKRVEAGSVDAENVNKAADKIKELENRLKQHLKDNPELRRDYNREVNRNTIEKYGNDDILSNRKWLKSSFSTQKKFDKHIEKHLSEYGNITPDEYLNKARDLLAAPLSDDVEGFVSKEGFIFKYKKSTNDFAIGRADGKISTLYKPKDEYKHWLEQIEKYKEV